MASRTAKTAMQKAIIFLTELLVVYQFTCGYAIKWQRGATLRMTTSDKRLRERLVTKLSSSSNQLTKRTGRRHNAPLPVVINSHKINAVPDTGADESVISAACASQLGLVTERDSFSVPFKLANVRCIKGHGVVQSFLSFARGKSKSSVEGVSFRVFPSLAVPLILGHHFLKHTKTPSKYDDRLRRSPSLLEHQPSIPRIFHLSAPKQRLRCYIDGIPVYANADTGAEMNLASRRWAEAHNVQIKRPDRGFERVMLADGSIALISGQFTADFRGLDKIDKVNKFDARTYQQDFFILDGLTSDILLCQSLLFHIQAFKEQQHAFMELDHADAFADMNLVTWLSEKEKKLLNALRRDRPSSPSTAQATPNSDASLQQLHVEAAREQDKHAQITREVATLVEAERAARLAAEENRYQGVIDDISLRLEQYLRANASSTSGTIPSTASSGP
ncbi:hypothetical protein BDW69DRAFT_187942 [Aspergillus filifer]